MQKIDWVRKLTSRKFWLAITSFVSMLIISMGGTENQATQAVALIMAGASVVAYVIGEGLADSWNAGGGVDIQDEIQIEDGAGTVEDPQIDDRK